MARLNAQLYYPLAVIEKARRYPLLAATALGLVAGKFLHRA
jgi:hypothetical protein